MSTYFNTTSNREFQTNNYANLPFTHGTKITTRLPTNLTAIRIVVTIAFTALAALALKATVFMWPAVVLGAAFTGWTIYNQFLKTDPLIQAFHTICGGKDKFEQLPSFDLQIDATEKLSESILTVKWDSLTAPISKAKTVSGNNIIFVKAQSSFNGNEIYAFVEKMDPRDLKESFAKIESEKRRDMINAIVLTVFGHNLQGGWMQVSTGGQTTVIDGSLDGTIANQFYRAAHQIEQIG